MRMISSVTQIHKVATRSSRDMNANLRIITPAAGMSPDQPIDVSILVVSYNTRALTLEALASAIHETSHLATEIIVVDNASTDGSAEAIAAHASHPRLIASTDNLGFARANNLAAREARGELILLLNPDTLVRDGAIDRLADRQHLLLLGGA